MVQRAGAFWSFLWACGCGSGYFYPGLSRVVPLLLLGEFTLFIPISEANCSSLQKCLSAKAFFRVRVLPRTDTGTPGSTSLGKPDSRMIGHLHSPLWDSGCVRSAPLPPAMHSENSDLLLWLQQRKTYWGSIFGWRTQALKPQTPSLNLPRAFRSCLLEEERRIPPEERRLHRVLILKPGRLNNLIILGCGGFLS